MELFSLESSPYTSPLLKYSSFKFCVSYAVIAVKTRTATTEMIQATIELAKKMLTMLAMISPNIPMRRNVDMLVRSFFVVYPYRLAAAKIDEQMKNTFAMLAVVNEMKMMLRLAPIAIEYA